MSNPVFKEYPKSPSYLISEDGLVFSTKTQKILKTHPNSRSGYIYIMIMENGKRKNRSLHRMVYEAHKGEIDTNMTIDHVDGNRLNNAASNLEQVSFKENLNRSVYTQLTHHSLEQKPFDSCKILSIITLYSSGYSVRKLQAIFKDNKKTISGILVEKGLYLEFKDIVKDSSERSLELFGYKKNRSNLLRGGLIMALKLRTGGG